MSRTWMIHPETSQKDVVKELKGGRHTLKLVLHMNNLRTCGVVVGECGKIEKETFQLSLATRPLIDIACGPMRRR